MYKPNTINDDSLSYQQEEIYNFSRTERKYFELILIATYTIQIWITKVEEHSQLRIVAVSTKAFPKAST